MKVKRNSTFSSEIQQQQQNTTAMAIGNAAQVRKTVRKIFGSKDCNLAKTKKNPDGLLLSQFPEFPQRSGHFHNLLSAEWAKGSAWSQMCLFPTDQKRDPK